MLIFVRYLKLFELLRIDALHEVAGAFDLRLDLGILLDLRRVVIICILEGVDLALYLCDVGLELPHLFVQL